MIELGIAGFLLFILVLCISISGNKRLRKLEQNDLEYKKYIKDKFNFQ